MHSRKKDEKTLVFATAEDTKIRWEKKKSAGGDRVRKKTLSTSSAGGGVRKFEFDKP